MSKAPVVLHVLAILVGWAALTLGLGRIGRPDIVWPVSVGLLLLSISGWGHLRVLFGTGLYTLTKRSPRDG